MKAGWRWEAGPNSCTAPPPTCVLEAGRTKYNVTSWLSGALACPADRSIMDMTLSLEQDVLRRSAQAFLTERCPTTLVRRLRSPESDGEALELLRAGCELG